jgi:hypothetical protein
MKTMISTTSVTALLLLGSMTVHANAAEDRKKVGPTGIVSVPYAFDKQANGYDSMTFIIRIDAAPDKKRSFYYAMQYKFIDGNGGYIGIQPRGGNKGMAVFSIFGDGAVPVAANCHGGADGGQGVSCSKAFTFKFNTSYHLDVVRDKKDKTLWRGFIKDTGTGKRTEIGSWKPKAGAKGLEANSAGFVEYFPLINDCSDISATKGFFGHPSAKTPDGKNVSGKIGKLSTYGRCKDMPFSTGQTNAGSSVTLSPK